MTEQKNNTLSIIALVVAVLGILIAFLPCVGIFAILPGILGAILGAIAYFQSKDTGSPTKMSLIALIVSIVAIAIAGFQFFYLSNQVKSTNIDKEYTSCEELVADWEKYKQDLMDRAQKMEDGEDKNFTSMTKFMKDAVRMERLEEKAEEMGCELSKNFDLDEIKEGVENDTLQLDEDLE